MKNKIDTMHVGTTNGQRAQKAVVVVDMDIMVEYSSTINYLFQNTMYTTLSEVPEPQKGDRQTRAPF